MSSSAHKKLFYTKIMGDKTILNIPFNMEDYNNTKNDLKKKNLSYSSYEAICKKEMESPYVPYVFKNKINIIDRLETLSQLAWLVFNDEYGMAPCEHTIENVDVNIEFLDFLRENAKLISRKVYDFYKDSTNDVSYLFSYKNYFIGFSLTFPDKIIEGVIRNLIIFHKNDDLLPLNLFTRFYKIAEEKPRMGVIKTGRYGPSVSWMDHVTKYKFNELHYNEDFADFFQSLQKNLNENDTGLYLMYGEAGTGKSSAIRHLITQTDRKVVFIPPQMINCLSNPDFTELVTNNLQNCILVIEDAEKALMKRETEDGFSNSELVSSVLNLTDGLYADLAKTSIIATYNCDRSLIDPALLRKGRLRAEYHFKKLSLDRTKALMKHNGHDVQIDEEMTLADIFNYTKQYTNENRSKKKKSIGFGG
jgi:hypothetical protein